MSNEIVLENEKQGNPESEWGLPNGASSSIEGFTTDISTNLGGTVQFKINTDANNYRLDIYRLGYYDGDGARLVGVDRASLGRSTNPLRSSSLTTQPSTPATGASPTLGRSLRCGLRRLHRQAGARGRHAGRKSDPLHRQGRRRPLRRRLPNLGYDLAGVQHLGRRQPVPEHSGDRHGSRLRRQLQSAGADRGSTIR